MCYIKDQMVCYKTDQIRRYITDQIVCYITLNQIMSYITEHNISCVI